MEDLITVKEIFIILKKNVKLIFSFIVIFGVLGFLFSHFLAPKSYTSKAEVLVLKNVNEETSMINDVQYNNQLYTTYKQFLESETILKPVANAVSPAKKKKMTLTEVADHLKIESKDSSLIISIEFEMKTKKDTELAMNTLLNEFSKKAPEALGVNTIDVVTKEKPIAKKTVTDSIKNAVFASVLGFIVSLFVAIFKNFRNETVKELNYFTERNILVLGEVKSSGK